MTIKFADLFSGCGGLSHGFHADQSFECVRAVDSWPAAVKTYNAQFKTNVAICRDLYADNVIDELVNDLEGSVDVLLGGPPCQGFSTLGKRQEDCKKSVLVDTFLRMACRIKPRILIMENVRGIVSKRHPAGGFYSDHIDWFVSDLYNYESFLLNATEYGLAQTRVRYFLVATLKATDRDGELLRDIVTGITRRKSKRKLVLSDVISDLPRLGDGCGGPVMKLKTGKNVYNHRSLNHSEKLRERFAYVPPGGGLLDVPTKLLTGHLKRMVKGKYGSGGHVKNIYGRLEWDKPCGTIVAGIDKITCGRYVHPEDHRLLTPRECARIQSYPDDFIFEGSNVTQYYLIGNSVPPRISKVLGSSITSSIKINSLGGS